MFSVNGVQMPTKKQEAFQVVHSLSPCHRPDRSNKMCTHDPPAGKHYSVKQLLLLCRPA